MTRVVLHYLQCRGRGQALRSQLSDAEVEFEDRRYGIKDMAKTWPVHAAKEEETGPFASVPVLQWGEAQLAQTLALAFFLDEQLGLLEGRTLIERAQQRMMTSAASLDITWLLGLLLWQPLAHPKTDWSASVYTVVERVASKLLQLERLWSRREQSEGPFFWGRVPSSADYAVFEAWHTSGLILQQLLEPTRAQCSHLQGLEAALRRRPGFCRCEELAPLQQCASPVEISLREKIRSMKTTS